MKADHKKLNLILTNLMSNAVKFTQKGSIKLEVKKEKEFIVFNLIDTGIGIKKEHVKHIFDRFWQSDGSYTRQQGGTGIGLTLVAEFVKLHNGSISVDSTEGKGSTFSVKIPA